LGLNRWTNPLDPNQHVFGFEFFKLGNSCWGKKLKNSANSKKKGKQQKTCQKIVAKKLRKMLLLMSKILK
jgi:hypothetical protein